MTESSDPQTPTVAAQPPWRRYEHREMHRLLCAKQMSARWSDANYDEVGAQALFCPYYVPLEGRLGSDWGVIVNPASKRFGMLTFEHDDCGCPESATEDGNGWCRHAGSPQQDGDTWDVDWRHSCEHGWCDTPCEWAAYS